MNPVFSTALEYPTLPLTVLLAVMLMYWVIAATGLLGDFTDGFDFDAPDMSSSVGLSAWLERLGFSSVPFTAVASILILGTWVLTYLVHYHFLLDTDPAFRYGVGTVVLLVSGLASLIPAALLLIPIRFLFRRLAVSKSESRTVQGHEGYVVSTFVDKNSGRINVSTSSPGVRLILEARSLKEKVYPHQAQIVVVSHDVEKGVCEVVSREEFENPH